MSLTCLQSQTQTTGRAVLSAGDKGEEEVRHGALAERRPEEEAAGAAPPRPALPRGLPARREALLPARKALPARWGPPAGGRGQPTPFGGRGRVFCGLRGAHWPGPSRAGISLPSALLGLSLLPAQNRCSVESPKPESPKTNQVSGTTSGHGGGDVVVTVGSPSAELKIGVRRKH